MTIELTTFISIVSLIGSATAFFISNSQRKKIIELESLQKKKALMHEYQFKKEFEIYGVLWKKMVDLVSAAASLRPFLDFVDPKKSKEEIRQEKFNAFNQVWKNLNEEFLHNKPFYSDAIFQELNKLMNAARIEAIDFEYDDHGIESRKTAEKNADQINKSGELICSLIKKRIEFMEK